MTKHVVDFLRWAEKLFIANKLYFGHGTQTAWDEAVFIASYVLDLNLYQESLKNRKLTEKQLKLLQNIALTRANTKQPLPYIIKTAWFAGKKYYVNSKVLVPRSPIAELINKQFKPWLNNRDHNKPIKILDLCTGSGCIAIACFHALVQKYPQIKIDASDICANALKVAKKNLELHGLSHKINLIKSNLFENITNKYDLIISNPPYVDQKTFDHLPKEFYYEPKKALLSGNSGLELVIKILNTAKRFLSTNGILIVEVGVNWKKLAKLVPQKKFLWLKFVNGGEGVFLLTKEKLI